MITTYLANGIRPVHHFRGKIDPIVENLSPRSELASNEQVDRCEIIMEHALEAINGHCF
jgi:hypothetical protein